MDKPLITHSRAGTHAEKKEHREKTSFTLIAFLLLVVSLTSPAAARKDGADDKLTVSQLEQVVGSLTGQPDESVSRQLESWQLVERLNRSAYAHLKSLMPGERARESLLALADSAEFLPLPAAENPYTPAPAPSTQRELMASVVAYTTKTLHQLPNFFAVRRTTHFEDRPEGIYSHLPLHFVGATSDTVAFQNGQEMLMAKTERTKKGDQMVHGLVSWGEFGPILSTVLLDAAQSKLVWSRWEKDAQGTEAVFSYTVPERKSHYWVQFCCISEFGSIEAAHVFREHTGYHGDITVNPDDGSILRLTVDADLKVGEPLAKAQMMVEYGSIQIGGKVFICPTRSVAISLVHASAPSGINKGPAQAFLNDVEFGEYHRFGAESRILTADGGAPASSVPNPAKNDTPQMHQESEGTEATDPTAPTESGVSSPSTTNAQLSYTPSLIPLPETPARLETPTIATASPSNDTVQTASPNDEQQTPILRVNSHTVVVDIIVRNDKGEPVRGLGKDAFELLEDGKPQLANYFEEHTVGGTADVAPSQLPPNVFTNAPLAPQSGSVNILLIDHLNTPFQDQVRIHEQTNAFLKHMQPGTQIAIAELGSKLRIVQPFSTDSSLLLRALNDKKTGDTPESFSNSRSRQDDADDQQTLATHASMMGANQSILGTALGTDVPGGGFTRTTGGAMKDSLARVSANNAGSRVAETIEALEYLARYLAGIPGRKNLIWFSTAFPITVFPTPNEQQAHLESRKYDPAIKEAARLLTFSKVAVYPVSAEGVQLDNATEASGHGQTSQEALYQLADARAIRTADLNKLAADTGGKAFYNTNDLAAAIARAIDDGAHYYTLAYSPTNLNMDGSYRRIEVRVAGRKYDLAYRHGYYADDNPIPETQPQSDPLHPLLIRGTPSATQILFKIDVHPSAVQRSADTKLAGGNAKISGPLIRYSVDFSIRSADVRLEAAADNKYTGTIQIELVAYDSGGNAVNWSGGTLAINMGGETNMAVRKTDIPAHLEIDLPKKAICIEAGVFDLSTRKAGTLEVPIEPRSGSLPGNLDTPSRQ